MREDNLLGVEPKAFIATTQSDYGAEVYLNLASRMRLTAINQLWVADITFIRLRQEFVYLALVLDAFSRKVVGWDGGNSYYVDDIRRAKDLLPREIQYVDVGTSGGVWGLALDRSLTTPLPLLALQRAIARRQPAAGLVHHSDRGVQYASEQYTRMLQYHGILPSMSRPGNPYDNAFCESFIETLKREEIYAHEYKHIDELAAHLEEFIDHYYNRLRLHSALGYKTPAEFEAALAPQVAPDRR